MTHEGRTLLRETTRIGQCFQLSSCLLNPKDCITHLQKIIEKSQSEVSKQKLRSKLNLLCELMVVNHMPFDLAFEEYIGMLNDSSVGNMNNKRQSFVDALLSESSGIPCMIVNVENSRHLLLLEKSGSESHYRMFKALGEILNKKKKKNLTSCHNNFHIL
ncbi:unnamed protein product [Mytilus coruscus]|uniref:Uncharacterized protein n=1 Tax=Mytilus coruscus TaxID=42192 RepID=A0A6J8EEC7_MYTCO|nr:unnamed protein product [Mytilus coruscus]